MIASTLNPSLRSHIGSQIVATRSFYNRGELMDGSGDVEHPVSAAPDNPAAPQVFTLPGDSAAVYTPEANLGRISLRRPRYRRQIGRLSLPSATVVRTAVSGPYRSIWVIALRKGSSEIRMRPR